MLKVYRNVKMEKLANCSTFSGYSNDNAKKFLSEFMSYALLHDLHAYDGKKVAAFHLHLKGPALTWYNALSDFSKRKWESVQVVFEEKFINFANNNTMAMMERQVFNALKLGPGQTLEDYHSQIIEKGTLLQKPEHEIIARFIDGFPEKAAFFVRAGQPPDLTLAFTSAKIAETCGYRQSDLPSIATSPKQQDSSENTNIHTLTQEVAKLSKTVSELVISKQSGQSNSLNQPSYFFSPQQNVQLTCYSCNFPGHKRKDCN